MTPNDPLGLRYSQCQEFLPDDERTFFDEFEGRFKIDRLWRSKDELRLERTYKKAWALLPMTLLVLLLSATGLAVFFGNRVVVRVAIQLPLQFLALYLFLGFAAYETLTRKFSLRVDPSGIHAGKRTIPFAEIEEIELAALIQGWPRTYVRLLCSGKRPEDILRARGALSAYIVHGALTRMVELWREPPSETDAPVDAPVDAPPAIPEVDSSPPKAKPPRVQELGRSAVEPATTVSDLKQLATVETALGRDGYGDRAFRWSFRAGDGGWRFRCWPRTVFRPLRPGLMAGSSLVVAVVLFGNGLWLFALPLTLIGVIIALTCLRGISDRRAEVGLTWNAGGLQLERPGQPARRIDPAGVLSIEPEERGERVWLRIQLPDGPQEVAAALQVEPILELRETLISTLEARAGA